MNREELIQSIVESLAKLQRPSFNTAWKQMGLSHAQTSMLYLLFYHDQASVKEVADYLGISRSAVTQLMDPLAVKRLVNRQTDAKDRRIVRLSLTPKGTETLKKLGKYKFAGLRSALEKLNDHELSTLRAIHQKMAGGL